MKLLKMACVYACTNQDIFIDFLSIYKYHLPESPRSESRCLVPVLRAISLSHGMVAMMLSLLSLTSTIETSDPKWGQLTPKRVLVLMPLELLMNIGFLGDKCWKRRSPSQLIRVIFPWIETLWYFYRFTSVSLMPTFSWNWSSLLLSERRGGA